MDKCIVCNKKEANNLTHDNYSICNSCAAECFICSYCGRTFPDYTYDSGDGICQECLDSYVDNI